MSTNSPFFFKEPLRYMKWISIYKPAYFYSIILGFAGPIMIVTVPPIRRYMGYEKAPRIPQTYPIPTGPRPRPSGFEDDE